MLTISPESSAESPAESPNRRPIVELTLLALPTVLQMFAYTVEQFTDTLMLARIDDLHATACGYSGGVVFCVISFGFGVLMLVNALVSEAYGARRHEEVGRSMWQGVLFAIVYALLAMPLVFLAPTLFRALGHAPELVALEVTYFNVSILLLVAKMLAIAMGQFMLAINRPNIVLVAASAGMVLNVFVNWLLIYGHWGLPRLGIAGAAWGTNAAIVTELIIVCAVAFGSREIRERYGLLRTFGFDRAKFGELIRVGFPSGLQTVGDVVAWTLFFTYVMAGYGTAAMNANNYAIQYMKISFMPAFGLSAAVTALVARYIGAGQPDVSEARAHLGFKVAAAYMATCAILFLLLRYELIGIFSNDPEVIRLGGMLLVVAAIFQFFDALFIVYNGALRGAKDTFVPTCVQIALCWTLIVAGGLAVAHFAPQWGVLGPWTIACIYCGLLGGYLVTRFRRGHWKRAAGSDDPVLKQYAAEAVRVEG